MRGGMSRSWLSRLKLKIVGKIIVGVSVEDTAGENHYLMKRLLLEIRRRVI
jgi:hypothetical protein